MSSKLGSAWGALTQKESNVRDLSLSLIDPPDWQPRQKFEREALDELKNSIKSNGLLQPIVVEPYGDRFKVVAGERRYKAVSELGWEVIQVRMLDNLDEKTRLQVQIAENLHREDITPIERSRAIFKLLSFNLEIESLDKILNLLVDYGKDKSRLSSDSANTVLAILNELGKSHMTVYRWLQLLKLPEEVQAMLDDPNGALTPKHAGELLKLEDINKQIEVAKLINEMDLSVDQTKVIVDTKIQKVRKISPQFAFKSGTTFINNLNNLNYEELDEKSKIECLKKIEELKFEVERIINDMKKQL